MQIDLFQFRSYREYLKHEFAGTGSHRGRRALLARALACQTSYLSQVLTDRAQLSLEHAIRTADFLDHTLAERKYFMLLVQKERAGSKELRTYFDDELSLLQKRRNEVKERINVRTSLSEADQMIYYSTWHYCAIHVLSSIPEFNSVESFATRLKLSIPLVKKVLQFLEERNFVKKTASGYTIGSTRIHLAKGSAMLPRHHANWRMKAIAHADEERASDLHYSAVLGISKKDIKGLKEKLLQLLQDFEPMIKESKEEDSVVFLLDLFQL
jgi:uncharacterized protein (TIGR02147 family)